MNGEALPANPLVHFTPIEDADGHALDAFHTALRAHEAARDGEAISKLRIAMYGASSVSADRFTGYMRGYFQQRFGDGGIGFVALVPLWQWHRHNAVKVKASKHWAIEHAQRKKGRLDGRYGILGASAYSANKRAWAELRPNRRGFSQAADTDTFELYSLRQPDGGSIELKSGKTTLATIATSAEAFSAGHDAVELGEQWLPLRLNVKGNGEVRLFGASLEREQSGLVLDTLGIGGTRAANIVDWDDEIWTATLVRRAPSLYVLQYGANESVDEDEPIETYRKNLGEVLDTFAKTLPDASCVLAGPVDFPKRNEETEEWEPRPRIAQIIDAQRELALEKGCGFFDSRALTGGPGTMDDWSNADPPLAKKDHLHLTPLGYLYYGQFLTDALMAGYDAKNAD